MNPSKPPKGGTPTLPHRRWRNRWSPAFRRSGPSISRRLCLRPIEIRNSGAVRRRRTLWELLTTLTAGDALNGKKVPDDTLRAEIEHFVTLKQQALESDTLPVSETLRHYLATTRTVCEAEQESLTTGPVTMEALDDYFFQSPGAEFLN